MVKLKGQSLVEVVVSIGLVVLAVSGVVSLLVNVMGSRTKSFDRTKATELAQKVVEGMINDKSQDAVTFWDASKNYWNKFSVGMTDVSFPNYNYRVKNVQNNSGTCNGGYLCVEAIVSVGWNGVGDTITVSRLFTKY